MKEQNSTEMKTPAPKKKMYQNPLIQSIAGVVAIFVILGGFLYWQSVKNTVFIENSVLVAPVVNLSPSTPGVLNALYVKEGDRIAANTAVALVGSNTLTSTEGGIVTSAPKVIGSYFSPGQTVVSVVNDPEMKVVGTIEETKGLSDLAVGQQATFTVDAFPGKTFDGIVDEISPVSENTGVVFDISDKRPVNKFAVKVRFDIASHPELKSGMSAKITVHTK